MSLKKSMKLNRDSCRLDLRMGDLVLFRFALVLLVVLSPMMKLSSNPQLMLGMSFVSCMDVSESLTMSISLT